MWEGERGGVTIVQSCVSDLAQIHFTKNCKEVVVPLKAIKSLLRIQWDGQYWIIVGFCAVRYVEESPNVINQWTVLNKSGLVQMAVKSRISVWPDCLFSISLTRCPRAQFSVISASTETANEFNFSFVAASFFFGGIFSLATLNLLTLESYSWLISRRIKVKSEVFTGAGFTTSILYAAILDPRLQV